MTTDPSSDVVERLRRAAQSASDIARQMAEAKSLRQAGNTEGRTDLYMWPTPEQTLEGKALATIERLSAELERKTEALIAVNMDAVSLDPETFEHGFRVRWAVIAKVMAVLDLRCEQCGKQDGGHHPACVLSNTAENG